MSRRLLRAVCTAALATALVVSPATAAPAEPDPVPSPTGESAQPEDAAEVDAESALAAPEAPEALGAPKGVATLLRELQTLYQEAEEASETYNATAEKLKQRTAEAKKVGAELAKARAALELSRGTPGGWPGSSTRGAPSSPPTSSSCWPVTRCAPWTRAMSSSGWRRAARRPWSASPPTPAAPTPWPPPRARRSTSRSGWWPSSRSSATRSRAS